MRGEKEFESNRRTNGDSSDLSDLVKEEFTEGAMFRAIKKGVRSIMDMIDAKVGLAELAHLRVTETMTEKKSIKGGVVKSKPS